MTATIYFKKTLLIAVLSILFHFAQGQTPGVYTIGGNNPDFVTIQEAIDVVRLIDTSEIILNVRPGVYNESVYFSAGIPDKITLQSEDLDSTSVLIKCDSCTNTNTLNVYGGGRNLAFRYLNIQNYGEEPAFLGQSSYMEIEHCTIYGFDISWINLKVKNCNIYPPGANPEYISELNRVDTSAVIQNCHFKTGLYTLFADEITFDNNTFEGSFEVTYCDNSSFTHNSFHNSFELHYCSFALFHNNVFSNLENAGADLQFNYTNYSTFSNNKVGVPSQMFYAPYLNLHNNFFSGKLEFFSSQFSNIHHNNFGGWGEESFMLFSRYCNVRNNNFSKPIIGYIPHITNVLENNNYFPYGSAYDPVFTNYDPMYVDSINLYAQNPQLAGIGVPIAETTHDIDSVLRPNPPSIGANEICISKDTFNIACGDSLPLALCGLPQSGSYNWFPISGLNNAHIAKPKAAPANSGWYTVTETQSGYVDSIYLNVVSYQVIAYNDTLINCGDTILLFGTHNASASYEWSPTLGLESPHSRATRAGPEENITYHITSTVPGCGTTTDSVTVNVDPTPRAASYYTDSCLTLSFNTTYGCVNSFYWDFGDGFISSLPSPSHTYDTSGTYYITFIYSNDIGADTLTGVVTLECTPTNPQAVNEIQEEDHIRYYPNPTNGVVKVLSGMKNGSYTITDISGRQVMFGSIQNPQFEVDLSALTKGVYFINLFDGESRISVKVVRE